VPQETPYRKMLSVDELRQRGARPGHLLRDRVLEIEEVFR
jgi:hypothetical protein